MPYPGYQLKWQETNYKIENLIIQVESLNKESLNKEESYRNMRTKKIQ